MKKYHFRPLILTSIIIFFDQLTKLIIIRTIPLNSIGAAFAGDFFRIIHVRNLGAAFSLGEGLPPVLRIALVIILPVALIIGIVVCIIRSDDLTTVQRWLLAGIAGGGIGNVFFDRIFRPLGVVDFLDFKFYGLFGFDRWPTFNVADSATVICGTLLMINLIFGKQHSHENNSPNEENSEKPDGGTNGGHSGREQ